MLETCRINTFPLNFEKRDDNCAVQSSVKIKEKDEKAK